MRGQPGFFDVDDRLKRFSDFGDQLEAFCARRWISRCSALTWTQRLLIPMARKAGVRHSIQ
jgi:hypothetical protein